MPSLFLSPSTQEYNPYITSENEAYWMNRIADELEPYLCASGIRTLRNDPQATAADAIRASNAEKPDFHLALHSNASPFSADPMNAGISAPYRGIDLYFYPTSAAGRTMAELLEKSLKTVYPLPDKVRTLATTSIGEVRLTDAPAVLAELGYHDNEQDAKWIERSTGEIARALAQSITEYFSLPFSEPFSRQATVVTQGGALNLRSKPDVTAPIVDKIPNGTQVTVCSSSDGWYAVRYGDSVGFVKAEYLVL